MLITTVYDMHIYVLHVRSLARWHGHDINVQDVAMGLAETDMEVT